jgi:hypothetical protein
VFVAAVHKWLGAPLGERWAEKLWSLAEYGITTLIVYGPFARVVQRQNALAAAAQERKALHPGVEDDAPSDHNPPARRTSHARRR